jgi:hypothetical protein
MAAVMFCVSDAGVETRQDAVEDVGWTAAVRQGNGGFKLPFSVTSMLGSVC